MSKLVSAFSVSKDTVVRLLTIVFTPVAAGGSAWLAKHGVNLPASEIVSVGTLSGAAVLGLGFHWLQKQPAVLKGESDLDALADKISAGVHSDPAVATALEAIVAKLESQRSEILSALDKNAPASVQEILAGLLAAASGPAAVASVAPAPTGGPAV